jgi:4-hydroxy-tetrahydrodipicolinate synthase
MILYNVPGRTVADMSNDTILRLAHVPGVIGIKDATGDIGRGTALLALAPGGFTVLSGDDASAAALILMGGKGNISVTANVAPRLMSQMVEAALAGDIAKTRSLHNQGLPLHKHLFCEASPIPVKWALTRMGKIPNGIRLPLTHLSTAGQAIVEKAMHDSGLI